MREFLDIQKSISENPEYAVGGPQGASSEDCSQGSGLPGLFHPWPMWVPRSRPWLPGCRPNLGAPGRPGQREVTLGATLTHGAAGLSQRKYGAVERCRMAMWLRDANHQGRLSVSGLLARSPLSWGSRKVPQPRLEGKCTLCEQHPPLKKLLFLLVFGSC